MSEIDYRAELKKQQWVEGAHQPVLDGSYRFRLMVCHSSVGRNKAEFSNGEHPYFSYISLINPQGKWIEFGNNIVPVLPDGRLLMVVEQRLAQFRCGDTKTVVELRDKTLDLKNFGPFSSLEFPGGGVNPGESITMGILRELGEESGVCTQAATLYRTRHPQFPFGSDIALQMHFAVVFLSEGEFATHVTNDGGLRVLTLHEDEVQRNIWNGVIASGQAALSGWHWYQEVKKAQASLDQLTEMEQAGYLVREEVVVSAS